VVVLHCKTRLIFGAYVKLRALFDAFHELNFKIPFTFGACVELGFPISIFDVLHFRAPLKFGACAKSLIWQVSDMALSL